MGDEPAVIVDVRQFTVAGLDQVRKYTALSAVVVRCIWENVCRNGDFRFQISTGLYIRHRKRDDFSVGLRHRVEMIVIPKDIDLFRICLFRQFDLRDGFAVVDAVVIDQFSIDDRRVAVERDDVLQVEGHVDPDIP